MKTYLIILALMTNLAVADDHDDLVHFAAHFGMSYAINTFSYGLFRGMSKSAGRADDPVLRMQEMVMAAAFTLIVGFSYKAIELAPPSDVAHSMFLNVLGVAAANISFVAFQW